MRAVLLSVALLLTVALGGIALVAMRPPPAEPVLAETVAPAPRGQFLVAARPIRPGTLVRGEDMSGVEMDIAQAPAGARRDTRETRQEIIGAMARRPIAAGDAIRAEDVLRPGDRGFLAAVLGPDMRAFSVAVDLVTGAAGLIWPGDRVDLLLTQQINDEAVPAYRRIFGETVLTDVRVIAIDQAIVQGAVGDGPENGRQVRTVTLEVDSREAEHVAVATRLGRLSLLLRSAADGPVLADTGAGPLPGMSGGNGPLAVPPLGRPASALPVPVWGGDVSTGLRQGRPDSAAPQNMRIFLGGNRREEFRF